MKRRGIFWALAAALLVTAAFLGPWLLLRREQKAVLDQPRLLDASAYLLEGEAGDLLKKLAALADSDGRVLELVLSGETEEELPAALARELAALAELGAVPASLPRLAEEARSVTTQLLCVVDPSRGTLFEVCDLHLPTEGITARVDRSTGKLLYLRFWGEAALEEYELLMNAEGLSLLADQAAAWAVYYGLEAGEPALAAPGELGEALWRAEEADYLPGTPAARLPLGDAAQGETELCLWLSAEFGAPAFTWRAEAGK